MVDCATSPLGSCVVHAYIAVTEARTYVSKTTRVIGRDGQRGIEHDYLEHAYPLDVCCRTRARRRVQRGRVCCQLVPDESRQQSHSESRRVLSARSTEVSWRICLSKCAGEVSQNAAALTA
jgi:hypothetical protein